MKKKIIRPKHSDKSNTNIKILVEETAAAFKGKGIDASIPPPELNQIIMDQLGPMQPSPKKEIAYAGFDLPNDRVSIFSGGFGDSILALSLSMGFVSLGYSIGLAMR